MLFASLSSAALWSGYFKLGIGMALTVAAVSALFALVGQLTFARLNTLGEPESSNGN